MFGRRVGYKTTDIFLILRISIGLISYVQCKEEHQVSMEIQGQVVNRAAGTVYSPFIDLEPNQEANQVVKALVLKVWKIESKRSGQVWGLEIHLMDQN
ncbi:hypothetical protein MKW92_042828, partial [Papaver armeniacum]